MEQLPQLNEHKIIPYNKLPKDIHQIIFTKYLLKDLSDTEAIKAAKNLALTCREQYSLLLDPIKERFELFIFSTIDFTQYTINDPLCNLFITILPADYYLSIIQNIKEQKDYIIPKIIFINTHNHLSEEKITNLIAKYEYKTTAEEKYITDLSNEIEKTKRNEKPLMINAAKEKLYYLQISLTKINTQKELMKSNLDNIKKTYQEKEELIKNTLFNTFYTSNVYKNGNQPWTNTECFSDWIDPKIHLIYLFLARTLLQPLLYNDNYYKKQAKMLVNFDHTFYKLCSNIIPQMADNDRKKIKSLIEYIMDAHLDLIKYNKFPLNYTNFPFFNQYHQKIINLPHYVYRLNKYNLYINAHWINAFYKNRIKKALLYDIELETKDTKDIQLTFYAACNLRYAIDILMEYINDNNPAGDTTITIKTVSGIEHFTKYNQRFLYCLQNNQYPNITCVFQVPKEKETETKTFFYKKPWLNWYNTLYYLNQDIEKGPKTWGKLFEEEDGDLTGFWTRSGFLLFIGAMLCSLQTEDQLIISAISIPCSRVLHFLSVIGSRASQGSFVKNTVGIIPWYIIHALLRDTLLLYSIYQYHNINYMITAYTLFELYMVQKSLFYKPLFENLYKQYKAKNNIIITTY